MAEGFIEKTKDFFGFGAIESYDDGHYARDDFDEYQGRDGRDGRETREDREADRYQGAGGRHAGQPRRDVSDRYAPTDDLSRNSGAPIGHDRRSSYGSASAAVAADFREPELVVVQVSSYRDAGKVTPEIKRGDIVAFNLSALDKPEGNQFLAFIMGVAAALDAKVDKLEGARNFALVPAGARLSADIRDSLAVRLGGGR